MKTEESKGQESIGEASWGTETQTLGAMPTTGFCHHQASGCGKSGCRGGGEQAPGCWRRETRWEGAAAGDTQSHVLVSTPPGLWPGPALFLELDAGEGTHTGGTQDTQGQGSMQGRHVCWQM